jgi:hypothetical protein
MTRALVALALCGAAIGGCTAGRTRVLVDYRGAQPVRVLAVDAVNTTGRDLPMPSAGLIERAVQVVTQQAPPTDTIPDAFVTAATERLAQSQMRSAAPGAAAQDRLQITLRQWEVRDEDSSGAVVFVGTAYELLDAHGAVLWAVEQDGLPVRLSGPNLSRYEVARIARTCIDAALASLPAPAASH